MSDSRFLNETEWVIIPLQKVTKLGSIQPRKTSGMAMPIKTIYSFLTYARKGKADDAVVSGTAIPPDEGKLCKMLGTMFNNAHKECSIPIMFSSENGIKVNGVRDEIMALVDAPNLDAAKLVAIRLQKATTGNSGMGLLFISIGDDGGGGGRNASSFLAFPQTKGWLQSVTLKT